jgi:hypothetical protein
MTINAKRITALVVACGGLGLGLGAAAIANAGGSDKETPITASALKHATDVALAQTGGGRVTQTEVNDEEGYYQVEVTHPDGTQTDVNLDRGFNVVKTKTEGADSNS